MNNQEYNTIFNKYNLEFCSMSDDGNGCYRFSVHPAPGREYPLNKNELKEICSAINAVCIEVSSNASKQYIWKVFYTAAE